MSSISKFPQLKQLNGQIYIPVVKENALGEFINYKADCETIVRGGQAQINKLIQAYLTLNQVGVTDTSNLAQISKQDYSDLLNEITSLKKQIETLKTEIKNLRNGNAC